MVLWLALNSFQMGGDWPYVQRYISVPTTRDARKSNYLVAALYLFTPFIWYLPAMVWRTIDPAANPEQAYILMGQRVLMKGMLGVMLAAMVSATMSTVSGTLNVYANVFTYEIWGVNHPGAPERKKIRIGRLFTLFFGLAIVAVALLVPYAGGAEKVVVPLLTMVMAPLCIPAVWGLFSRRISGAQVMIVPQLFLSVHDNLCTLKIPDFHFFKRRMQSGQCLRSDAVHHHFCAGVARQDKVQYTSDLAAAASDKDMGRNRQIDQRFRCPSLDDRHILKTIFCPVFREESEGIFFAFN